MTEPPSKQKQPEEPPDGQSPCTDSVVHRKVSAKGSGWVTATVVAVARKGHVWVSITPPFSWEAILEPGKVDELIHVLGLAREDAKRATAKPSQWARPPVPRACD